MPSNTSMSQCLLAGCEGSIWEMIGSITVRFNEWSMDVTYLVWQAG